MLGLFGRWTAELIELRVVKHAVVFLRFPDYGGGTSFLLSNLLDKFVHEGFVVEVFFGLLSLLVQEISKLSPVVLLTKLQCVLLVLHLVLAPLHLCFRILGDELA